MDPEMLATSLPWITGCSAITFWLSTLLLNTMNLASHVAFKIIPAALAIANTVVSLTLFGII